MPLPEWTDQLAASAMLGTERAGQLPLTDPAASLGPIIASIAAAPAEDALLSAAAIATLYTKAGQLAPTITALPPAAPPLDRPPVSATSSQHLALILNGHYPEVLPEYLDLLAASGRSPPARHLPALLAIALQKEHLRPRIVSTLGSRGRWLTAQNPEWANLTALPEIEHYHTGTRSQRLALLERLRNMDPAQSRSLVAATWSEEQPEDRAAFARTFATNLSMEDESFLESALDDRRKEVRAVAARLLATLPESRFAGRMTARLAPLVAVNKLAFGTSKISISVPESHDPSMARDGIDAKSSRPPLGDKAARLAIIIAATPLSFWPATLGLDAAALLKRLSALEWEEAVVLGLATGAVWQKDAALAAAVLQAAALELCEKHYRLIAPLFPELMALLSAAQREAALATLLATRDLFDGGALVELLILADHSWSKSFSEQFLPFLERLAQPATPHYAALQALVKSFPFHVHPGILPTITAKLSASEPTHSEHLDQFLAILHFRQAMHKELSS
jgi:hypothetical protein